MSRPAARFIHARTTDCPICGARRGRPCERVADVSVGLDGGGWSVTPHNARLKAEKALREKRTQ